MKNELISVVIPTYKRSEFLKKAINSVIKQTYQNFEILVIDDNQDDQEINKVRQISNLYSDYVRYIKNFRKKGGSGARNSGVIEANGKFIAFLDDDDKWTKNKLQEQVSEFNNSEVVLVASDFVVEDTIRNKIIEKKNSWDRLTKIDLLKGNCPASTSLILARRDVLLEVGLFDEDLESFQDFDMWIRTLDKGILTNISKPLAYFVTHSGLRTSVNLTARLSGLDTIIEKWGNEIQKYTSLTKFRNKYESNAYLNYAISLLENDPKKSVKYILKSIKIKPYKLNRYKYIMLALFKSL